MIQDIEGRDIIVGSEVILTRGCGVLRCKVEKFTKKTVVLRFFARNTQTWSSDTFYISKDGYNAIMYKIC